MSAASASNSLSSVRWSTVAHMTSYLHVFLAVILVFQYDVDVALSDQLTYRLQPHTTAYFSGPVCPTGCSSCSKLNGCAACQSNFLLLLHWHGSMRQTGSCVRACPSGYFAVRTNNGDKCIKCDSSFRCEHCTNRTNCARCAEPFAMHLGQCVDRCPAESPFVTATTRQCASQLDCEVGPWTSWGACSRFGQTCGFKRGRQKRRRQIVQKPSARGRPCPPVVEFRKCRMQRPQCSDTPMIASSARLGPENGLETKSAKRFEGNKWLQLALKHRKRKFQQMPLAVGASDDGDERIDSTNDARKPVLDRPRQRQQQRQMYQLAATANRRRVDINSVEPNT